MDAKPGLVLGFSVDVGRGTSKLQTGLSSLQMKSSGETLVDNEASNRLDKMTMTTTLDMNYIGLPVMLKHFLASKDSGFYFKGGLIGTYLNSAHANATIHTVSSGREVSSADADIQGDFHRLDVMYSIGGGFTLPVGDGGGLLLDAGYLRGLTDIDKGPNAVFNSGFAFTVGYSIFM
jgi:hypothetical protein